MSGLSKWFRSGAGPGADDEKALAERLEAQKRDLEQAMGWAELIMNDDIDSAVEKLQHGDSAFHDLGAAVTIFMKSVLGFEKSVMTETAERLNKVETRAWNDYQKSQKLGARGTSSRVYPPGTEYELVRAETQLMGAMVGVLHESLVEAMKSFLKLRKAYFTLDGIIAEEVKVLGDKRPGTAATARTVKAAETASSTPATTATTGTSATATTTTSASASVFVDAPETASAALQTPADPVTIPDTPDETTDKKLEQVDQKLGGLQMQDASEISLPAQHTAVNPELLDSPVDKFIHSGANMCFGILLLMLTLVPPAFSKVLGVVGFRGDRERGIRMLWQASYFGNINGAMAALMILVYYNAFLGQVDIIPADKDFDYEAEIVGPPRAKCDLLLKEMRRRYPDSGFWRIEQARSHARDRQIAKAIEVLQSGEEPKMKQVLAVASFELSMTALIAQDWALMRTSFLRCMEINDWSPGIYNYMVGVAALELYRDAAHRGDEAEARRRKKEAQEYMRKAPLVAGKNRFMARQLPLEVFIGRKMSKLEARAKEWKVDLADAAGVSPAMEMAYMWNGQNRMGDKELVKAQATMAWERCTGGEDGARRAQQEKDEVATHALLTAVLLRGLGRYDEARALMKRDITSHDKTFFKNIAEDYVYPAAVYEDGVLSWFECCNAPEGSEEETLAYRKRKLEECERQLTTVKAWESFSNDARVGMRVQSGMETLAWFRKKMGWAKA